MIFLLYFIIYLFICFIYCLFQHTSYTVEDLEPSTEYQFRISAGNKHGFSEPGAISDKIGTTDKRYSQHGQPHGKETGYK